MPIIRIAPAPPASNNDQSIWGVWFKQVTDAINRIGTALNDAATTLYAIILSGSTTSTLTGTAGTNITSVGTVQAVYSRVNSIVTMSGYASNVTFTAANTFSSFDISLPIASNFGVSTDALGTISGVSAGLGNVNGKCYANTTSNRITIDCESASTGGNQVYFTIHYKVI